MDHKSEDMMVETPGATQEVIATARDSAQQVKALVSEEASRAADTIRTVALEQMDRQKGELAGSLRSVEQALRKTSEELENPILAPRVEQAADALHSAHQFLEHHGVEDVGVAVRRISLQHPVIFYTGIFALGFAAGRFLTASAQQALEPVPEVNLLDEDLHLDPLDQQPMPQVVSHHGSY